MLQTSTTDSEINLFPHQEMNATPVSALSADDEAFYTSIKEELNKLSLNPPQEAVDHILKHSKSVDNL